MAGRVAHVDIHHHGAGGEPDVERAERGGLRPQVLLGQLRRPFQVRRRRRHLQLVAVPVEHPEHKRVAAAEPVLGHAVAIRTQHGRNRRRINRRHVAILATLRLPVPALRPLQVRHLLGEPPLQRVAVVVVGGREERVAGGAELRLLDVRAMRRDESGGGGHHSREPLLDIVERAEERRAVGGRRGAGRDDVSAVEALVLAEVVRRDLMADRARHAIPRLGRLRRRRRRAAGVREHFAHSAIGPRGGARHRHVAGGARVLDRSLQPRVVHRLPPDGRLPVGVACRIRHHGRPPRMANGDVGALVVYDVAVTGDALIRGGEHGPGSRRRRILRGGRLVYRHRRDERQHGRHRQRPGGTQPAPRSITTHPETLRRTSPTTGR